MNIKEAKTEIKNAVLAYRTRDALGNSVIPIEKQRPIFLMGPPGIGKTAIMEQVAQELNIGLVSYSMTHHTQQSALGLPFIAHRTYCGMEFDVSEYTMSEIIASMYEMMETTGVRDLYVKYRADYQVDRILAGDASGEIRTRAHQAKFDERLALIGQMLDMAFGRVSEANTEEAILKSLLDFLKPNRAQLSSIPVAIPLIESRIDAMRDAAAASRKAGSLSQQDADVVGYTLRELARYRKLLTDASANNGFDVLKKQYEARLAQYRSGVQRVSAAIDNMLIFAADAFGQGQELSMMITELSIHKGCAHFISRNGSREYFRYSQNLLFYERRKDIIAQIEELGL